MSYRCHSISNFFPQIKQGNTYINLVTIYLNSNCCFSSGHSNYSRIFFSTELLRIYFPHSGLGITIYCYIPTVGLPERENTHNSASSAGEEFLQFHGFYFVFHDQSRGVGYSARRNDALYNNATNTRVLCVLQSLQDLDRDRRQRGENPQYITASPNRETLYYFAFPIRWTRRCGRFARSIFFLSHSTRLYYYTDTATTTHSLLCIYNAYKCINYQLRGNEVNCGLGIIFC